MTFDFRTALKTNGGVNALAAGIGVSHQAISQWRMVPPRRVLAVEAAWGISRHVIRPDIYGEGPNAPTTPLSGNTSDHAVGSSAGPNPETVESPLPVRGSADPVVTPAPTGG